VQVLGQRDQQLEVDRVGFAVRHPEHGHSACLLGIDRSAHLVGNDTVER